MEVNQISQQNGFTETFKHSPKFYYEKIQTDHGRIHENSTPLKRPTTDVDVSPAPLKKTKFMYTHFKKNRWLGASQLMMWNDYSDQEIKTKQELKTEQGTQEGKKSEIVITVASEVVKTLVKPDEAYFEELDMILNFHLNDRKPN